MAQDAEHVERKKFLRTVPIFTSLSEREISRIADRMQKVTFEAETAMITEGDDGDAMYIIQDGQAVVSQAVDADNAGAAARSQLRVLKPGDYFGERALLIDQKRSASVRAASTIVSALRISKATFRDGLPGGLRDRLIQQAPTDRRLTKLKAAKPKQAALTSRPVKVLDKHDFEATSRYDQVDVEVTVLNKPAVRITTAVEKVDDADVTLAPELLGVLASNAGCSDALYGIAHGTADLLKLFRSPPTTPAKKKVVEDALQTSTPAQSEVFENDSELAAVAEKPPSSKKVHILAAAVLVVVIVFLAAVVMQAYPIIETPQVVAVVPRTGPLKVFGRLLAKLLSILLKPFKLAALKMKIVTAPAALIV